MSQQRITLWTTWGVLLLSVGVYVGVAVLGIVSHRGQPNLEFARLLAGVLAPIAVGTGVATFALRRRLLTGPLAKGELDPESPSGAQKVQVALIVAWILSEAVAIWGLVIWMLSGSWPLSLPYFAGGAGLLLLHAPRESLLAPPPTLESLASGQGTIG